jgi:uncharacterized lipoprotein YmbA
MKRHRAGRGATLLVTAVALTLMGCAGVTDASRYYVLSSTSATPTGAQRAPASNGGAGVAVGVGPVLIPGYLNRAQIVTRSGSDELDISTYHRWAEPLENGIGQVLANDLAAQIGSERIAVFPWRGGIARVLDYQVAVVVLRFEGLPGGQVTLDARWRLVDRDGQEIALKRSTMSEAVPESGYQSLVMAMNRLLDALAREIAAEILARADARASGS